jgi:hypothetical protein
MLGARRRARYIRHVAGHARSSGSGAKPEARYSIASWSW